MRLTENQLKRIIRDVILEASKFTCNYSSLGFISTDGNFIDLEALGYQSHGDYAVKVLNQNKNYIPPGWIKVSNANNFKIMARSWEDASEEQIFGMIDVWDACKDNAVWIRNEIENEQVYFLTMSDMEIMTIPEFISSYGNDQHMTTLFLYLLG